jgi:hypothetical protein
VFRVVSYLVAALLGAAVGVSASVVYVIREGGKAS